MYILVCAFRRFRPFESIHLGLAISYIIIPSNASIFIYKEAIINYLTIKSSRKG